MISKTSLGLIRRKKGNHTRDTITEAAAAVEKVAAPLILI